MIVLRDVSEVSEGTWFEFKVRGEDIKLKIRPYSNEVYERIRKKYKKTVKQVDPHSRAMINADVYDEEAITDELIDYLLESFEGFGSAKNQPLEINLKNKKRVVNIPTLNDYETSISDFVFSKARELSAEVESDDEVMEKN
jgi:bifunctional DNA-binding transcriptional regulator/antitoxin component of YhaV-PrlF toxin-antitoxin module